MVIFKVILIIITLLVGLYIYITRFENFESQETTGSAQSPLNNQFNRKYHHRS